MSLDKLGCDAKGFSMVEVLVALIIFSVAVLGLTSAVIVAGAQLRMSRVDILLWAAVHYQLDNLTAQGYDNVTAGTATVRGYPMTWDVQGTDPKKIILVTQVENSRRVAVPDTFITYIADRTP